MASDFIAQHLKAHLADILEGKAKPETMPIQYQKNFKTVFNETAVKNLGLTIPADVKHELVK